jgi:hypothetical protein
VVFFLFQLAFTGRKVTDERAGEDIGGFFLTERVLQSLVKLK